MRKKIIEGYGPLDLIERVRNASWVPCLPSGHNFAGMSLGGYALVDTPDNLCSVEYRVTLEALETEDKFTVEGFSYSDLLFGIEMGEPAYKSTTFADSCLTDNAEDGTRLYRVTVEIIS